jgi:hypothetical protein
MLVVLVIAGTLLLCWLVDKGFEKLFRNKPQHVSGKSVRLNKYYGVGGLILTVLGISAVFSGMQNDTALLLYGGILLIVVGIALIVYYMTFGVFYDNDSFVLTTFGKKSTIYRYADIRFQQLYRNQGGSVLIELYLRDGRSVQLQSTMKDVYDFMDTAFAGWCHQRGIQKEDCGFYDPDNSCWFPGVEE